MLAAAAKRLTSVSRVTKSAASRTVSRRNCATDAATKPMVESLLAKASRASKVSAVAAKIAWEKESGLFVDLRPAGSIAIEGFEKIPLSQLAKSLAKVEQAAKEASAKDIYFLDLSGYQSSEAVNLLAQYPQFAGYNVHAIEGGLNDWIADNGPYSVTNADVSSILDKLRAEVDSGKPNEHYINQVAADLGITPPTHEMLVMEEGGNDVIENPLVITDFNDQEAFGKFVQRVRL